MKKTAEFNLDDEPKSKLGRWLNYIEGVARIPERSDAKLKGADLIFQSDVPTDAGLSPSAALETAVGLALSEVNKFWIDRAALASKWKYYQKLILIQS